MASNLARGEYVSVLPDITMFQALTLLELARSVEIQPFWLFQAWKLSVNHVQIT